MADSRPLFCGGRSPHFRLTPAGSNSASEPKRLTDSDSSLRPSRLRLTPEELLNFPPSHPPHRPCSRRHRGTTPGSLTRAGRPDPPPPPGLPGRRRLLRRRGAVGLGAGLGVVALTFLRALSAMTSPRLYKGGRLGGRFRFRFGFRRWI